MIPPYKHRLLARYGSELIELVRFNRAMYPSDLRHWTEGVEHYVHERTLTDRECITSRPVTNQRHTKRETTKLTWAEREALAMKGWLAEYKNLP